MHNILQGIEYPMLAGLGAIVMLATATPILAVLALFFPVLWGWVFVPVGVGAIAGLIAAVFVK